LGLSESNPQGLLIVGANPLARAIAKPLAGLGFKVSLLDINFANVSEAQADGLTCRHADALVDNSTADLDLSGIGRMVALTSNDYVNSLAALRYREVLGSLKVYQLVSTKFGATTRRKDVTAEHLRGQYLFGKNLSYERLTQWLDDGADIQAITIPKREGRKSRHLANMAAIPLFIARGRMLLPVTAEHPPAPRTGDTVIALVHSDAAFTYRGEATNADGNAGIA
jgi:CPA1 family monovalent cation:H+ antiporter